MRTAVCFTGTARSLEHTHENLVNNLINIYEESDVFLYVADNPHVFKIKKYFNNQNVKKCLIVKEPEYDLSMYRFEPGWPNPSQSSEQTYIKMLNSRAECGKMLLNYEKENDIIYDRVIFSRMDISYFESIFSQTKELDLNNLYIPDFHNTFGGQIDGYNDRFAISNRKNMQIYFNAVNNIRSFIRQGGLLHGETFLKWHLKINQISVKKIPVRFTRVRSNGEEIDKRLKNISTWKIDDT